MRQDVRTVLRNLANKLLLACNRVGEQPSPLLAARPMRRFCGILPLQGAAHKKKKSSFLLFVPYYIPVSFEMGGGGFEPPKHKAADLQSVPFGHSGIHPYVSLERLRTHFLSVTKKLYHIFVETASIIFIYCNALRFDYIKH